MKNKLIRNSVPELLSALCSHDDCPEWISDAILDGFNNRLWNVRFTPEYFKYALTEAVPTENCPVCNKPKLEDEAFMHDGCRKFLTEIEKSDAVSVN